ncbi:putative cation transport protein ChaC [Phaeobacter inhibens]|uniref:glutathione-specific gamma-glutamylcyclotransferase n=1 Tax=Phaeobacter inhibens TaxID=221822 RepID=A0ABN5GJL3_9RHOB|nr:MULTISPECIES: gamma-glutamylcyclotransferase [Phaeobacter]AUQ49141.1 putative cation transport protein ChaC [Phaeobacter inhibens]AUQ93641.1 putative cation transport protein ChaC [Phaeobacter inhibens]AUR18944.1 putative cation transport protein ChaC [Phaeobacter inhibens]MBQ4808817.1 gamma-glutamylcyclotransferase [Phaeobacter sp. HS012]MBQ4883530.1 gamma-glutamylcyclotransferase [Phaeobacter sp. HS011]
MTMWVFGYGSLLWNPGFPVARREVATLPGYARSFCMKSIHHRGSEEKPGLVLALDAIDGAACTGIALAVEAGHEEQTLLELRARELISSAYVEKDLTVQLASGGEVTAVTYVIDPDHNQYCGGISLETQARIIAEAVGGRGPNTEYLFNTAEHLAEIGLRDADLDWLSARVRDLAS